MISTLSSDNVYLVLNRLHCDLRGYLDSGVGGGLWVQACDSP